MRGRWVGRFCQSCRSSSGRSSFPPLGCLSLFSHRRCAVSFAFAVPSCGRSLGRSRRMWLPCSAVALLPVPRALISSDFGRNCDTRCVKSVREVFSGPRRLLWPTLPTVVKWASQVQSNSKWRPPLRLTNAFGAPRWREPRRGADRPRPPRSRRLCPPLSLPQSPLLILDARPISSRFPLWRKNGAHKALIGSRSARYFSPTQASSLLPYSFSRGHVGEHL